MIREPDDLQFPRLEDGRPNFIRCPLIRSLMRFSIEFDNKARFPAVKVNDEPGYPMLSAEAQAIKPAVPKALPKQLFGRRALLSKLAS